MRSRILSAKYTMLADFYAQITEQSEAGQIVRTWNRDDPYVIKCRADGILVAGFTSTASTEKWREDYEPVEYVKLYIQDQVVDIDEVGLITINRRFRVSNIRDRSTNKSLWLDDERKNIEFHITGITPIQDPFGRNVEYELLLKAVVAE
jgi:hypothetical protein